MKYILYVIIIFLLAGSCSKEETNIGTVEISFAKIVYNRTVEVFAMENTDYPIYAVTIFGQSVSTKLSFGNYLVSVYSPSEAGIYDKVGFQLNNTKTLKIVYDEYNRGQVK